MKDGLTGLIVLLTLAAVIIGVFAGAEAFLALLLGTVFALSVFATRDCYRSLIGWLTSLVIADRVARTGYMKLIRGS